MNLGQQTPSLWPEDRKLLTWDTSCTCLLLSSLCWNSRHCQLHWYYCDGQNFFKITSLWAYVWVYPSHCCHYLTDLTTDSTLVSLLQLYQFKNVPKYWKYCICYLIQLSTDRISEIKWKCVKICDFTFTNWIPTVMQRNLKHTL